MDFKRRDIEAMPDQSIAVTFINGGVRMSEQEEWVHMLRRKSQLVVAFGRAPTWEASPAWPTSTTGSRCSTPVYQNVPSQDNQAHTVRREHSKVNGHALELPRFWTR